MKSYQSRQGKRCSRQPLHAGLPLVQQDGFHAVRQSALHKFCQFEVQTHLAWPPTFLGSAGIRDLSFVEVEVRTRVVDAGRVGCGAVAPCLTPTIKAVRRNPLLLRLWCLCRRQGLVASRSNAAHVPLQLDVQAARVNFHARLLCGGRSNGGGLLGRRRSSARRTPRLLSPSASRDCCL